MSSRCHNVYCLVGFMMISLVLISCDREKRQFAPASAGSITDTQRASNLQPAKAREQSSHHDSQLPANYYEKYEGNGYAVSQGKRLFRWYNCSGCHSAGGGSIGPALMDGKWQYGGQPQEIFATIHQGRPNGMPSFAGHIPDDQLWQIVAYVRSMSGQLRKDVAPSREDKLSPYKPESRRQKEPLIHAPTQDVSS